jgi:hypothetical protein
MNRPGRPSSPRPLIGTTVLWLPPGDRHAERRVDRGFACAGECAVSVGFYAAALPAVLFVEPGLLAGWQVGHLANVWMAGEQVVQVGGRDVVDGDVATVEDLPGSVMVVHNAADRRTRRGDPVQRVHQCPRSRARERPRGYRVEVRPDARWMFLVGDPGPWLVRAAVVTAAVQPTG